MKTNYTLNQIFRIRDCLKILLDLEVDTWDMDIKKAYRVVEKELKRREKGGL